MIHKLHPCPHRDNAFNYNTVTLLSMGSGYFRVVLTDPEPTQIFTSKGELLHQMGRGSRKITAEGVQRFY